METVETKAGTLVEARTMFKRHFSELKGMQEERTVTYELLLDEQNGHGVRIVSVCGDNVRSDTQAGLTASACEAKDLVTYLYENAASIDCWRDIAVDLLKTVHHLA